MDSFRIENRSVRRPSVMALRHASPQCWRRSWLPAPGYPYWLVMCSVVHSKCHGACLGQCCGQCRDPTTRAVTACTIGSQFWALALTRRFWRVALTSGALSAVESLRLDYKSARCRSTLCHSSEFAVTSRRFLHNATSLATQVCSSVRREFKRACGLCSRFAWPDWTRRGTMLFIVTALLLVDLEWYSAFYPLDRLELLVVFPNVAAVEEEVKFYLSTACRCLRWPSPFRSWCCRFQWLSAVLYGTAICFPRDSLVGTHLWNLACHHR